jgi:hypothetical protein
MAAALDMVVNPVSTAGNIWRRASTTALGRKRLKTKYKKRTYAAADVKITIKIFE